MCASGIVTRSLRSRFLSLAFVCTVSIGDGEVL